METDDGVDTPNSDSDYISGKLVNTPSEDNKQPLRRSTRKTRSKLYGRHKPSMYKMCLIVCDSMHWFNMYSLHMYIIKLF